MGLLKKNVDAAFSDDEGIGSAGAVPRDFRAKFVAAALSAHSFCGGFDDGRSVVETMLGDGFSATIDLAIFLDSRSSYLSLLAKCQRSFVRKANAVAHEIAKN
ncbi:hypothetical protein BRADI_1g24325v3 [Brachypodium distachyon]|uniref:Uncharacterized protein n=1 Tax=Brachypodium distachyon TaxID=15368 RepID=A0A2K2DKV5_BRADI|nr:hypothetical protein BRADI_1g24325v3 [Brachypodium distachyon]